MSKTVYTTLKIVYYFLKIFGLSPYHLTSSSCTRSVRDLLWGIIVLIAVFIYCVITIINRPHHSGRFIDRTIEFLDVYSGLPIILCGFICQWVFTSQIKTIIDYINNFDQFARQSFKINLENKYAKFEVGLVMAIFGTTILICLSIASTTTMVVGLNELTEHFPVITIPKIVSNLILLPFFALILSLRQRFLWMNSEITKKQQILSNAIVQKVANSFLLKEVLAFLETVRIKHSHLCAMCRMLNKAYRAQFLAILMKNVISITIGIFYSGYTIINESKIFKVLFFAISEATVSLVQTLALTYACAETTSESRKTFKMLHKLTLINNCSGYYSLKKKIQMEIIFFSLQSMRNKVEFTAFHMFVIRERFLVSVVATIVTYLIIVIQLSLFNVA